MDNSQTITDNLATVLGEIVNELIPSANREGEAWDKSIIFLDIAYFKSKPGLMAIIKTCVEPSSININDSALFQVKIYPEKDIFIIEISVLTPGAIVYKGWCNKDFQIQRPKPYGD